MEKRSKFCCTQTQKQEMVSLITQTYGLLPGYHMNKKHWISVLLDDSVGEARILDFLDMIYDLIDSEKMKKR